jgi:predicted metalloprotease with PDZ domain
VLRDGPAWTAGLAPGEELIAIDGFRVDDSDARTMLETRRPGARVVVTSSAWGRLREVPLVLGTRPSADYRIRKRREADASARRVLQSWLGRSWEDLRPLDEPQEDERRGRGPRTT